MLHPFTTRCDNPTPPSDAEVYGETFETSGIDCRELDAWVEEMSRAERETQLANEAAEAADAAAGFPPSEPMTEAELEALYQAHLARVEADEVTERLIAETCAWGLRWDTRFNEAG